METDARSHPRPDAAGAGFSPDQVQDILDRHRIWLESGGREGARADLTGAKLRGAALWRADLRRAELARADLGGANLDHAQLAGACLRGADLAGASLWEADLSDADLGGADLRGAKLDHARLRGTDARGANLDGTSVWGAHLEGANLAGATGVTAVHGDPATPARLPQPTATLVVSDDLAWETWDDPDLRARSALRWRLIFSGSRTPTTGISMGLAELAPGGVLPLHHHAPAEVYHVLQGEGLAEVEGERHALRPGTALFIPGNARHRTTNTGTLPLRVVFSFPSDRFEDVTYHFDE
jgi:quercetin dioxygenase-like cupin family protein